MSAEELLSFFSFNIWRPYPTDNGVPSREWAKQHNVDFSGSNQNWLDTRTRTKYDRPRAIQSMLNIYKNKVDVFAFQELTLPSYQIILHCIGDNFACIHTSATSSEPNGYPTDIFWNKTKYKLLSYDYKTKQQDGKPLYWCIVRLLSNKTNQIINVISPHFHCCFYENELLTGASPRVDDMKELIKVINTYVKRNEAVFVGGDFNDFFIAVQYFLADKNLLDTYSNAFGNMGKAIPFTFPTPAAYFCELFSDGLAQVTYDWQFFKKNGINLEVETISADVVRYHDQGIYPSDHYPLHAVYRIRSTAKSKL